MHTISSIGLRLIIWYTLLNYLVAIARSCTRYWANIGTYRTTLLNSSTKRQQTFSISKLHSLCGQIPHNQGEVVRTHSTAMGDEYKSESFQSDLHTIHKMPSRQPLLEMGPRLKERKPYVANPENVNKLSSRLKQKAYKHISS